MLLNGIYHGISHKLLVFSWYTHKPNLYHTIEKICLLNFVGNKVAAHDGKVGLNAFEYTTAFRYSDWLYFL